MKKYGLIGEKLGHSYSKIIHEHYFELSGMSDCTYDLIEIPRESLFERLEELSGEYAGINVTIPYKTDVMQNLTDISYEARKIGAVNTILFSPEGKYGYNTDYFGLKYTFENNRISIKDRNVVILGTGGASKAALTVCVDMGASSVTFVTSGNKRVEGFKTIGYNDAISGDVLINCTPVGMYPNVGQSPIKELDTGFSAVVDMIYNPSVTELMKQGIQNGALCVNGLNMLVAQGVYSEAIWNGTTVDEAVVKKIIKKMETAF